VFGPQPKKVEWIRRVNPHISYNSFWGFDDILQTEMWHIHPFEIQPKQGGRFGVFYDINKDNPTVPFVVFNRDGRSVIIPAGPVHVGADGLRSTYTTRARASPSRRGSRLEIITTATSGLSC
jgi:hypothetical protein